MAKAKLRRGIEMVKLANRIESLKVQEDDPDDTDFRYEKSAQGQPAAVQHDRRAMSKAVKRAIFREVVQAKVREMKAQKETLTVKEEAEKEARRRSFQG